MEVTGTLISYYFYCKRRLWLHANNIRFEDNSEDVALGSLVEERTYKQRSSSYKQVEIGSIKIDFYDAKNKIIHEVKKSSKYHDTHIWQIKYYIFVLTNCGIEGIKGVLEYPSERKTEDVDFNSKDVDEINIIVKEIKNIIDCNKCPKLIGSLKCRKCSYYDFCYSSEGEI